MELQLISSSASLNGSDISFSNGFQDSRCSDDSISHLEKIISLRSYNEWSPSEQGVTLAWKDVSVYASRNSRRRFKRIINGVTGALTSGSLVALMGSSGAGKSTLMSALAYRSASKYFFN
jgi:ABC-type glutathione transport system ATPase component